MKTRYLAITTPGTEQFVQQELHECGIRDTHIQKGEVHWQSATEQVIERIFSLFTPVRVLQQLHEFQALRMAEFKRKLQAIEWSKILEPTSFFSVKASSFRSKLYHTKGLQERLGQVIQEQLPNCQPVWPSDAKPHNEQQKKIPYIYIHCNNNHCRISISVGSNDLSKRGYRLETAKAPLQEHLAAVLLQASGWQCEQALIDPFCGSGTIPIEAALLADRRACQPTSIIGADRDAGACAIANRNAERAGVADKLQIRQQAISFLKPCTTTGHIITNPPYGKRIGGKHDMRNLFARFGNILQSSFSSWHLSMLCPEGQIGAEIQNQIGISVEKLCTFSNGGLPVSILHGIVP